MSKHVGRHRAPGYSPISELSSITISAAKPAAKATAVVALSGGMVATMTIPAQAAVSTGVESGGATIDAPALGPSVTAPSVTRTYGSIGFKKKPAVKTVSRSTTRTTVAKTTTSKAPVVAPIPAGGGSIIAAAASLVGIPYRYGGMSTSGTDCSGFTSMVYKLALGITLPRTAAGQQAAATKVSNPVPGDLIFFGWPAYHVGIYAGNGMLYDASHSGSWTSLRKIWTMSNVSFGRI